MRACDAIRITNDVNPDSAGKVLEGGLYQLSGLATWGGGNVDVQQLGPDSTTWLDTGTKLTANGVAIIYLPPGQYKLVVTTATGVYAALARVPIE